MRDVKAVSSESSPSVQKVLEYFASIEGKGILIGQHTQTKAQQELWRIQELTGKLPALCGFELLSYSPNINYEDMGEPCLKEIEENKGTLEQAWEWIHTYKGLVTFSWHWFSPIGGRDKAFYTEHTDFDASKAIVEGTDEYKALISDMDYMAGLLKAFSEKDVPILWRPFHECEGAWFWWGAKGPDVARKLYQIMYERYTQVHHLDNLIWVWNSPLQEGYVGDEYCDIISVDLYKEKHTITQYKSDYNQLKQITTMDKMAALGEIGTIPNLHKLSDSKLPWLWFMLWSYPFICTEDYNYEKDIIDQYSSDYGIDLAKLPRLY